MSQVSSAQNLPGKQSGKEKNNLWIFFSLVLLKTQAQTILVLRQIRQSSYLHFSKIKGSNGSSAAWSSQ